MTRPRPKPDLSPTLRRLAQSETFEKGSARFEIDMPYNISRFWLLENRDACEFNAQVGAFRDFSCALAVFVGNVEDKLSAELDAVRHRLP